MPRPRVSEHPAHELYAQLADTMADVRECSTEGEAKAIALRLRILSKQASSWAAQLPDLSVKNGVRELATDEDEVLR